MNPYILLELIFCLFSKNCQTKGNISAIINDKPTNEKTIVGGNQGMFPLLPSISRSAEIQRPAMMQVRSFLGNNFKFIRANRGE
ncbi:hypothetical protein GCM10027035_05370 [Emticicia sediminis]